MTYPRNMSGNLRKQAQQPEAAQSAPNGEENSIRIDGFEQVLEMLKIADPEFRESILRRLAARDKDLARSLRADLAQ